MRLIFMGTPAFGVPVLEALIGAGHEVVAVYSQPPRPAGRGKKPKPSPVQLAAEAAGLTVRTPLNFKAEEERAGLAALEADAAVVVAYGLLLPQAVLDAPRLGCFNLHASLLPRWRGAAPIQRAIMAGDAETGVCVMRMTFGLDEGPVLAVARTPIGRRDTAGSLAERLSEIGAPLMVATLTALAAGTASETPQPEAGAVYAKKIDKAEAEIDWKGDAAAVDGLIRGLSPSPGAWFLRDGERTKALLSERVEAEAEGEGEGEIEGGPGRTLDDQLTVACGRGAVRLLTLQPAGKRAMSAEDYLRGRPTPAGTRVG
ncbi:MAG: methionyl-tRNA formyltransferase [Pseudomonadota bacterium]